jgi:hypothetical protein
MQLRKQHRRRTRARMPRTAPDKPKAWPNSLLAHLPADVLRKLGKLPELT